MLQYDDMGCVLCVNVSIRQDFINEIAIITKTEYIGAIMFDGQPVTTQTPWSTASNWGYSYAAFPVTHGVHFITTTADSGATFGAYSYGHSLVDTSSSAYGVTVGFKGRDLLTSRVNWQVSASFRLQSLYRIVLYLGPFAAVCQNFAIMVYDTAVCKILYTCYVVSA